MWMLRVLTCSIVLKDKKRIFDSALTSFAHRALGALRASKTFAALFAHIFWLTLRAILDFLQSTERTWRWEIRILTNALKRKNFRAANGRERLSSAYLFGYIPLLNGRGLVNLRRDFAFPRALDYSSVKILLILGIDDENTGGIAQVFFVIHAITKYITIFDSQPIKICFIQAAGLAFVFFVYQHRC